MILRRLLIANRGEIAARIMRTCRRLGIESVLAASDADLDSVPARLADQVVRLGPAHPSASYLSVDSVIAVARAAQVDAIHPGYGFLSENAALARACTQARILFVGPTEQQLERVGDKLAARRLAVSAGLPVVPGGSVASVKRALTLAQQIGWPVLIKAVGGGGGRGMKPVHEAAQLAATFELARAEANVAFGDARLYLERLVPAGRHVEVQMLGDGRDVVHLGDRDCSIQRRYQKLVEEAPAPRIAETLRRSMHEAALRFGRRLKYRGLGTVEFLLDVERQEFYFLEMNARIQVEHPVTEAITGLDLVEEQIALVQGQPLRVEQGRVAFSGHAIECRINAEDCRRDFQPSPGVVKRAVWPAGAGIRVDTHIETGTRVPALYDSLLAKVIAHGRDRAEALARMRTALAHCQLQGIATNFELHAALLDHPEFARGGLDTTWLPRNLAKLLPAAAA